MPDTIAGRGLDLDRFRLRRFVDELVAAGDAKVIETPTALVDIAGHLQGEPKAVLFTAAGPERVEVVGNVLASRSRLARALDVSERDLLAEVLKRLRAPIPPVEIEPGPAPVQEVILEGEEADLTALPANLQHDLDGAPYISAGIDFAVSPETGWTNAGMRRLMLRGRKEAGIDLVAPSDLRMIYSANRAAGRPTPLAIAIGCHPADTIASLSHAAPQDEIALMGGMRGAPVPVVKCIASDLRVPADAELVIEGWLDPEGWTGQEGPYGEYVGYYGTMRTNPVFRLSAITRRRDALFQTVTIGGRHMAQTDTAQIVALRSEAAIRTALETAVRAPVAVCVTTSCGGMYNARISLRQTVPGEARNAIAAVFGSIGDIKHVFVTDEDIDVFSDAQVDWAFATRFQADRDLVIASGFRVVPLDPSLQGAPDGAKAGFDLTAPFGRLGAQEFTVLAPPELSDAPRRSVIEALGEGPKHFRELMEAAGSDDGREIVREIEPLYAAGRLGRTGDGRYILE